MADNSDIDNLSGNEDEFDMDGIEGAQDGPSSETLAVITALKTTLETNPNQYEAHTQLITLLKGADMFEELREAREAMNKIYPLSEGKDATTDKGGNCIVTIPLCSFGGTKQLIPARFFQTISTQTTK